MLAVSDRIVHRAWKTKGTIVAAPDKVTWLSSVTVLWDDGKQAGAWIPSLMKDFDYEEWGDEEEGEGQAIPAVGLLDTDDWTED